MMNNCRDARVGYKPMVDYLSFSHQNELPIIFTMPMTLSH